LERVVHERLRIGRVLLVVDNCEHLLEAAATFVQAALASCPSLVVFATSRAPLDIAGERVIAVPALALTTDAGVTDAAGSEAERLFLDRAGEADPAGPIG